MGQFELKYRPLGSCSILIEWPAEINENILDDVLNFKNRLKLFYTKQKVEINNTYSSILINYGSTIRNIYSTFSDLKECYLQSEPSFKTEIDHWIIPVCYDEKFGVDIQYLSDEKKLLKTDIVDLHSSPIYRVYFLGFLPGFLYLGGLDKKLYQARRSEPRLRVDKGSLAIGGQQTGIYPCNSPGGWHLIGKTPLDLFNPQLKPPCFAKSGDKISFKSVSMDEFNHISGLIKEDRYSLEKENAND